MGDPKWPSKTEMLVLRQLIDAEKESYGLELLKNSGGALKRGTVYVLLGRLEEMGYVESRQEESTPEHIGIPRRLYKATGLGKRVARALAQLEAVTINRGDAEPALGLVGGLCLDGSSVLR